MAEADASQIKLTGEAEAAKIEAIGRATADAYNKQVEAMGAENFGKLKITEQIADGRIKITPDVLIGGGSGGGASDVIAGLLSIDLMKKIGVGSEAQEVKPEVVEEVKK